MKKMLPGLRLLLALFVWGQAPAWQAAVAIGGGNAISAIAAGAGSDVFVAGSFQGAATFGSISLTSAGSTDAFVAKLTDAGSSTGFVWAIAAGGSGNDLATALAVRNGPVYAAGDFSGVARFAPFTLAPTASPPASPTASWPP